MDSILELYALVDYIILDKKLSPENMIKLEKIRNDLSTIIKDIEELKTILGE